MKGQQDERERDHGSDHGQRGASLRAGQHEHARPASGRHAASASVRAAPAASPSSQERRGSNGASCPGDGSQTARWTSALQTHFAATLGEPGSEPLGDPLGEPRPLA